jgi:hypothetical protein
MYKHKKYTDLITGKIVEVIDEFDDIVILDNRTKLKVNKLLDRNLFDDYIDPRDFFRNESLVNAFTEKIRQIPNETISKEPNNFDPYDPPLLKNYGDPMRPSFDEPAVLPYDPEEEKRALLQKAKTMYKNPVGEAQRQFESLKSIIEEPEIDEEMPTNATNVTIVNENISNPIKVETVESNRNTYQNQSVDPIIQMFRNAKRNTNFNIKLELLNKIPRVDFIEMMEDSYNTSIIDFLAEEFTNELLLNPQIIKDKIKSQINSMVYPKEVKETTVIKPKRKTTTEND